VHHPPNLLPMGSILHVLDMIPPATWLVFGLAGVAFLAYKFVYKTLGLMGTVSLVVLSGGVAVSITGLHSVLKSWEDGINHLKSQSVLSFPSMNATNSNQFINPMNQIKSSSSALNLNAMNPIAHQNPWLIATLITIAVTWGLLFLIYRSLSPRTKTAIFNRFQSVDSNEPRRKSNDGEFSLTNVEIGIRKDNGRPIILSGQDRFLHTLVVGSTGTGKTSRILSKGVYQDIRNIANGVPMDVMVLDPDGGFAENALDFAQKLGVKSDVIDLRGASGRTSTLSFNPFSGGDIADIVDNVRAVLNEQMGEQDPFFQNAQDDLVRTVIQVQVPLWPETDFVEFADLVTDPLHFRVVCSMVYDYATKKQKPPESKREKDKKVDSQDAMNIMWEHERPYVEARYNEMDANMRSLTLSAARSFLMDTRTDAKLEHLEKVTKGLKIVVNELATNERIRNVLRRGTLPMLDFKTFFEAGKDTPGRVIAIITGNRTFGKLFGKLFLVTLKMYALARTGSEWTRRPLYVWADEFSVFGTESFLEAFSQIRKYRVALTIAIQARSQLLDVSKKFLEVVEGNCRNKVLFPAPSANDAKFFENSLGSVKTIKETHQENKLSWFWLDNRNIDRRISSREEIDPRFRVEDLSYGLSKDEAVFMMTVENQAQQPFVGYTSFASDWAKKKRGFTSPVKSKDQVIKPKKSAWNKKPKIAAGQQSDAGIANTPLEHTFMDQVTVTSSISEVAVSVEIAPINETSASLPRRDVVIKVATLFEKPSIDESSQTTPNDPPVVIKDDAVLAETIHTLETSEQQRNNKEPVAQRFDLRKRTVNSDSEENVRMCPECKVGNLVLVEQKWRCTRCHFERKKR